MLPYELHYQANEDDGTCEYFILPSFFNYELTGSNHTIVCPEYGILLFDDQFQIMTLSAFFMKMILRRSMCWIRYLGWYNNSIVAQGDDLTTDEIDGFGEGIPFKFKVWDYSSSQL